MCEYGVQVTIKGGDYSGDDNALLLDARDSGTVDAPIVFQANPDDATPVRLHGGAVVPSNAWVRNGSTAGGLAVYKAELAPLGLAGLARWSGSFQTGWTCANGNRTELFMNGEAMTLARYPNKDGVTGTWRYLRAGAAINGSVFHAGTDESGRPVSPTAPLVGDTTDMWMQGFWNWEYVHTLWSAQ